MTNKDALAFACEGLTKREYFAAMVLAGNVANSLMLERIDKALDGDADQAQKIIARASVDMADALIAELNK